MSAENQLSGSFSVSSSQSFATIDISKINAVMVIKSFTIYVQVNNQINVNTIASYSIGTGKDNNVNYFANFSNLNSLNTGSYADAVSPQRPLIIPANNTFLYINCSPSAGNSVSGTFNYNISYVAISDSSISQQFLTKTAAFNTTVPNNAYFIQNSVVNSSSIIIKSLYVCSPVSGATFAIYVGNGINFNKITDNTSSLFMNNQFDATVGNIRPVYLQYGYGLGYTVAPVNSNSPVYFYLSYIQDPLG